MFAFQKFLNVFSKVVINFSDLKTFSKLYCIILLSYLYFCLTENKIYPTEMKGSYNIMVREGDSCVSIFI